MTGRTYFYAYWLMVSPSDSSKMIKCIRGPKDNIVELNTEVQRMWSGHYEVISLPTRDPNRAKGIISDKLAQSEGSLANALGRASWKGPKRVDLRAT